MNVSTATNRKLKGSHDFRKDDRREKEACCIGRPDDAKKSPNDEKTVSHDDEKAASSSYQMSLPLSLVLMAALLFVTTQSYYAGTIARQYLVRTSSVEENDIMEWNNCQVASTSDRLCSIPPSASAQKSKDNDSSRRSDSDDDDEDDEDELQFHLLKPLGQVLLLEYEDKLETQDDLVLSILSTAASHGWSLQSHGHDGSGTWILIFEVGRQIILRQETRTIDIFTPDGKSLLEWPASLSLVRRVSQWSLKPRAVPADTSSFGGGITDLYGFFLGQMQYTDKRVVARHHSPFQDITILDIVDPRQNRQMSPSNIDENGNSYKNENPDFFKADRILFLDGVLQSRHYGERAYHETLVHPGMFMHPKPKRVAIIGGGEGATLREVLKHSCVQEVVMIDIDQYVMDMSRKYLPQWTDCSDMELPNGLQNPTGNCFDDPRASVYAENAIQWFMDRYQHGNSTHEPFDVIIMDALDPGDAVEFSDILFNNQALIRTLYQALSRDGVFVSQLGEETFLEDPNPMWTTRNKFASLFVQNLGLLGFNHEMLYSEANFHFAGQWSFLVASKSEDASRWFATTAEIDLEVRERAIPTKSGTFPFHVFDGATMQRYQITNRALAKSDCLKDPDSSSCLRGPGLPHRNDADDLYSHGKLKDCAYDTWHIPHTSVELLASLWSAQSYGAVWNEWVSSFGMSSFALLGKRSMDVFTGPYTWASRNTSTLLQATPEEAKANNMLRRFWRIHACAAKVQFSMHHIDVS